MARLAALVLVVVPVVAGCSVGANGENGNEAIEQADLVIEIGRAFQETDEPFGLAGATAEGPRRTRVLISLDDPPKPALSADIRQGGCAGPIGGSAIYPLEVVEDGRSETLVDVPLPELRDRGYIILIDNRYCGDFFGAEEGAATD